MDFQIYRQGELIGQVKKKWIAIKDSCTVEIIDEDLEPLVIAIVVAIDCVKADEKAASAAST